MTKNDCLELLADLNDDCYSNHDLSVEEGRPCDNGGCDWCPIYTKRNDILDLYHLLDKYEKTS